MSRLAYQRQQSLGAVLDIGCGEQNLNWLQAVRIDRMDYGIPGQLVGDAHALPFKWKSFDTCILGDMLEHVENPDRVLREACRVARQLIVLTVPKDDRLPPGQHIAEARRLDAERIHPTINFFTEQWLRRIFHPLPVRILDWQFVPECTWMNWLITLEML